MFQLYIDEDSMDRDLARALRARGVKVMALRSASDMKDRIEFLSAWG